MDGRVPGEPPNADLLEHLAFQAWRDLDPAAKAPSSIEILKGKPHKEVVCRLAGVGPGGSAVIGKRCRQINAVVEDAVYRDVIPLLSIHSPSYYGKVDEANGEYSWLFLESVGGEPYSAQSGEHRLLRARWLALMHSTATGIPVVNGLPHKGPRSYLERLRSARETIHGYLDDARELRAGDLSLPAVMAQCDLLESRWDQLEAMCAGPPWTLVHGDFADKNLRVRQENGRLVLLPFDWGEAGWGPPAIDISHVDAAAYWMTARDRWSWLTGKAIEESAKAGRIFSILDAICWALIGLGHADSGSLRLFEIYQSWLADALHAAGLER